MSQQQSAIASVEKKKQIVINKHIIIRHVYRMFCTSNVHVLEYVYCTLATSWSAFTVIIFLCQQKMTNATSSIWLWTSGCVHVTHINTPFYPFVQLDRYECLLLVRSCPYGQLIINLSSCCRLITICLLVIVLSLCFYLRTCNNITEITDNGVMITINRFKVVYIM